MRTASDETERVRARNRRAVDQARARAASGESETDGEDLSRQELREARARAQRENVAREGLPPPDLTRHERRQAAQRAALEAGATLPTEGQSLRFQRDHTPRRVREAAEAAEAARIAAEDELRTRAKAEVQAGQPAGGAAQGPT